jgi:HEAT repeat protein
VLVDVAGDVRREQNVRRRAALALGLLPVEPATAKAVRDTLFSVLFESVGNNDDRLELWANAVYALGLRGDEAAVPRLAAFIARHLEWNDADHEHGVHREVMGGATGALGLFRDPVLVPNLVAAMKDGSGQGNLRQRKTMVSTFAAYALARVGDKSALPALREAVGDERSEVRRGALLALGALTGPKDAETIALLAGVVAADKDDTARGFAAISLGRSGADAAPDALRAAFASSGSPSVRSYAALGLGLSARVRPDRAVNEFLLAELLAKHDTYETGALCIANGLAVNLASAVKLTEIARGPGERTMRSHAAFALGLLGAENVPPQVLIELVASGGDPVIRHEAGLALGLARRRDGVDALIRVVEDGKGLYDRGSAAVVLGRIAGPEAAPVLMRVLRDEHELNGLRICAAHGLGLLLDDSEGRKLGLIGADVNWVNEINKVWLPTEVLDQMLLIMD